MLRDDARITIAHGSGGSSTDELIGGVFASEFNNDILNRMEDSAVLPLPLCYGAGNESGGAVSSDIEHGMTGFDRIAVTTDSFVVTPVIFRGGDIGRLSVCGTVNDLLMRGAVPRYITSAYIIREGTEIGILKRVVSSMAETAREAGVTVIAGDTKVIEADAASDGGVLINTTGIGYVPEGIDVSAANAKPGDKIILSGNLGDHHAAILSHRMSIENSIASDNAPLVEMVSKISDKVHVMRDVTRGGLGTILSELSHTAGVTYNIYEDRLPVSDEVRDFAGLLGLDPVYMGNEGKLVAVMSSEYADEVLAAIQNSRYGENAVIIGEVTEGDNGLIMHTRIGGRRRIGVLQGEGLPRIC